MQDRKEAGVAARTAAGAIWLIGSRLIARGIDFVLLLVLARLLGPADFGLVAIAMTLIVIVEAIMELPLLQALIRLPELGPAHFDTAFTLGFLRGLSLAAILCGLAWPFSRFYGDVRLVPLICVLGIAPASRGLSSPAMAAFARAISFHRDFLLEISGKLVSFAIAICLAVTTRSYWAIVANTVMTPVATALISYRIAPYRPRLSLAEWRVFGGFLGWTSAAQAISAINWQCDRLLLGRLTARAQLGHFSMASDLSNLPLQALVTPLLRPLIAAFAGMRHDARRLREAYAVTTAAILMGGLPIMLILSCLAEPAVRLVLGPRWGESAPILSWLALAAIPAMLAAPLGPLAMTLDRTHIFLRQSSIELCMKVPAVILGALAFGIPGVVFARLISAVLMGGVAMLFARGLTGLTVRRQMLALWRVAASGVVMLGVLRFERVYLTALTAPLPLAAGLLLAGCLAMGLYGGVLLLLWWLARCPPGAEARLAAAVSRLAAIGRSRLRDTGHDYRAADDPT